MCSRLAPATKNTHADAPTMIAVVPRSGCTSTSVATMADDDRERQQALHETADQRARGAPANRPGTG